MKKVRSVKRAMKRGRMRVRFMKAINDYVFEVKSSRGHWIRYVF